MENSFYCIKCKQFTPNSELSLETKILKSKNNKKYYKTKCKQCNSFKIKFIKGKPRGEPRGDGIVNTLFNYLPELHLSAEKGEFVPNGDFNNTNKYSYCGPGTKLEKRLKQGYKGINELDRACLQHDKAYAKYSDTKHSNIADTQLAKIANEIANDETKSESERKTAKMVALVMSAKSYIGIGLFDVFSNLKNIGAKDIEKIAKKIGDNEAFPEPVRDSAKVISMILSLKSYFGFGMESLDSLDSLNSSGPKTRKKKGTCMKKKIKIK